jgi:hypothetical protein
MSIALNTRTFPADTQRTRYGYSAEVQPLARIGKEKTMPLLTRLWVAWLTRRNSHSDTDRVRLSINVDGKQLFATILFGFQIAKAEIFSFNIEGKGIESDSLTATSVRLEAMSDDAWRPEHFFVWGVEAPPPFRDLGIFPLAIEMKMNEQLSKEDGEGVPTIPLRPVANGNGDMSINRLLVLLKTNARVDRAGTDNSLEIQIVSNERLVALCEIKDTAQEDLEKGASNFYTMPVILPFTRSSLTNESITLRIKGGMDNWQPDHFFLFGLDRAIGRPRSIVPLTHHQEWSFGAMEPDTTNGIAAVTLPLVLGS